MGQLSDGRSRRTGAARRIYLDLRDQIGAGVYAPGDRLPSSRALAEELGVSRTTVTAAFDQLVSEGYVISHQARRRSSRIWPGQERDTGDRLSIAWNGRCRTMLLG